MVKSGFTGLKMDQIPWNQINTRAWHLVQTSVLLKPLGKRDCCFFRKCLSVAWFGSPFFYWNEATPTNERTKTDLRRHQLLSCDFRNLLAAHAQHQASKNEHRIDHTRNCVFFK